MHLPRLIARNHTEAVAVLRERRAILLEAAAGLCDRAELFADVPAVRDELIAECRALYERAEKHAPVAAA